MGALPHREILGRSNGVAVLILAAQYMNESIPPLRNAASPFQESLHFYQFGAPTQFVPSELLNPVAQSPGAFLAVASIAS